MLLFYYALVKRAHNVPCEFSSTEISRRPRTDSIAMNTHENCILLGYYLALIYFSPNGRKLWKGSVEVLALSLPILHQN